MDWRPLTERERGVLSKLLSVEFEGVQRLRQQASTVEVVALCGCGCPSIDFVQGRGLGMCVVVNAGVRDSEFDGLFLWTIEDENLGEVLGGIEWLSNSLEPDPDELPDPSCLNVEPA